MIKERFWPRLAGAVAVVVLVLGTNEFYRHARALVDDVSQSKREIAILKRNLDVLQVQLDNRPVVQLAPAERPAPAPLVFPSAPIPLPMPMGGALAMPEQPARARAKPPASDEPNSLVSVVLIGDATAAAAGSGSKPIVAPTMDVQLVGNSK